MQDLGVDHARTLDLHCKRTKTAILEKLQQRRSAQPDVAVRFSTDIVVGAQCPAIVFYWSTRSYSGW
jgi:hypothetical protein